MGSKINKTLLLCATIIVCMLAGKTSSFAYEGGVVVSMGDSYSSGEGIIPFYGEELSLSEKVENEDWLAHRSQESWPGMLSISGIGQNLKESKDENWFFVAASGATTHHINNKQEKIYFKGTPSMLPRNISAYQGAKKLSAQNSIFSKIKKQNHKVDYVTITIGGNDIGFSKIIAKAATGSSYQDCNGLRKKLNDAWDAFDKGEKNKEPIKKRIKNAYKDIQSYAGEEAIIIVAGYPQLLSSNGKGFFFHERESKMINEDVSKFNNRLEEIVEDCHKEGMNIHFVSVEKAFAGHEAYTDDPYISKLSFLKREDINENTLVPISSYSIHPNKDGAAAYAKCVQDAIDELEDKKGESSKSNNEDENKCYKAYKQFLEQDNIEQKYTRNDGSEATKQVKLSECKFMLAYIDNDTTPELVVSSDGGSQVYSYENNDVVLKTNNPRPDFNNSSSWTEGYYEKTGYINNIGHIGAAMVNEIQGIDGSGSIVAEYFSDSFARSIEKAEQEGTHIDCYFSSGKDKEYYSGKEEYERAASEATNNQEMKLLLYANNTPENRTYLIKQDASKEWNNPTAAYRFNETAWTWNRGSTQGSNSAVLFHPNGTFSQYQYGSDMLIKEAGTYVVEGNALQLVEKEELKGLPNDLKYIPNGREFRSEKEIEMPMDEFGHATLSEGSIDVYKLFSKADSNNLTYETVSGDWYYAAHMEDFDVPITLNPDGTWTSEYPEEEYYGRGEYKLNGNVIELEDYGSSKIEKTEEGFLSFEIDGAVFIKGRENAVEYANKHAYENSEDWED